MRVLHVNLGFVHAASAGLLLDQLPAASRLCEAIAAQPGVQVTHLGRFWRDEDLERRGVRYHFRADNPRQLVARHWTRPRRLYELAAQLRPDVVQVYGALFPLQVRALRRRIGSAPLVVQPQGARIGDRAQRLVRRWGYAAADAFFFTAAAQADPWRRAGLVSRQHRVFEVTDGSTGFTPVPTAAARQALGVTGAPLVLWVARLHPRKSPFTGLAGLAHALDRLPHARGLVIGDGPLRPAVEAWLRERPKLAARLQLIGHVAHESLQAWYSAADLFLSSSPEEGSNWALIEAVACGALPVCTDIPPHRRLTGNGRFGELWPVGDTGACADALVRAAARVCGPEPTAHRLRAELRRHFDTSLSWDAVARDSVAAYRALLERHSPR